MSLSRKEVREIAFLARIRIDDDELDSLVDELTPILDWVTILQEVDTNQVDPLTSVTDVVLPFREDKVMDGGYRERFLSNAVKSEDGYYTVPKVVES